MAVVDASFLIDIERGQAQALAALERLTKAGDETVVPAQAAAEYLVGLDDALAALRDLEEGFTVAPVDRDHILEVARLARDALRAGNFPGWADAHIAAAALLRATFVVTANPRHFEPFDCPVWDYRGQAEPPTP